MFFKQIEVGPMQNFSYILGDGFEAALIDPGWEYERILEICKNNRLRIKKILLTHAHFDHVRDLKRIVDKTRADIYIHKRENPSIEDLNVTHMKDGDVLSVGELKVKVIHTPGHTSGSVCFLCENKLFTGDTLFVGTIGRTDLPSGNLAEMMQSLKKLKKLDNKTEIYPGHDYGATKSSTIGDEKKRNELMKL